MEMNEQQQDPAAAQQVGQRSKNSNAGIDYSIDFIWGDQEQYLRNEHEPNRSQ